jgi:tetratricopeptide (TPR) repeat protein
VFESRRGQHSQRKAFHPDGSAVDSWKALVFVFLAATLVYAGTLSAGFTNWDDPGYVLNNPDLPLATAAQWKSAFTTPRVGTVAPVQILSYALDYRIGGLRPAVYHLTNVLLHGLCAALLWILVFDLSRRTGAATLAALAFAFHPTTAEVVSWVAERKTLLCAVFLLAALLAYLRAEGEKGASRGALCVAFFGLGIASKVAIAPFPVLLLALHRATGLRATRTRVVAGVLCLALAVAFGVLTLRAHEQAQAVHGFFGHTWTGHARMISVVVGRYVMKALLPTRLCTYYDFNASNVTALRVFLGALFAGAALVLTILLLYRRRVAGFWSAGAWLLWLPASSLLVPISTPMADRYLYLPLLFLAPLAATSIPAWVDRTRVRQAALLASSGLLFLASLAMHQSTFWESSKKLWTQAVQVEPRNPWVRQKLAYTDWKAGDLGAALREARESVRINPYWLEGWETLGQVALAAGRPEEAEGAFRQQIGLAQNVASAYVGIARAKSARGQDRAALAAYAEALRLKPNYREATERLTAFARKKGLAREALAALPTSPTSVWIEVARGDLLESLGRREEAERLWRRILLTRPDFAPARSRLSGSAYSR